MDAQEMQLSLQHERDGAALYDAVADAERDPHLAEVYRRLAQVERGHAARWARNLEEVGVTVPRHRVSLRVRILIWVARRLGPGWVLPSLADLEAADATTYAARNADLSSDERSHARILRYITVSTPGLAGGVLAQLEGRHRAVGGNALRAAVLGANDGLVSNMSLVMGVAGAALSNTVLIVSGFAGLLAGAISMALGEWLSVQSSRELYTHQLRIEAAEIRAVPDEEVEELTLIYRARGIAADDARGLAERVLSDESGALETLAREELGVDPAQLGGSAWEAALASFLLFAVGAIIPVLPFLFLSGRMAVWMSLGASALGLFAIGTGITLFTARPVALSGLRQVVFGLLAAAVTYAIGRLVGAAVLG